MQRFTLGSGGDWGLVCAYVHRVTQTKPSSPLLLAPEPAVCLPGAFPLPPRASGEPYQEAPSLSVNVEINMRAVNWHACINSLVSAARGGRTLHSDLEFGEVVG